VRFGSDTRVEEVGEIRRRKGRWRSENTEQLGHARPGE